MGCASAESDNNYITAEFYINEEAVNEEVEIIDCIEHFNQGRSNVVLDEEDAKEMESIKNEEDIKKTSISINNKPIQFCYQYKFPAPGNYTIKYSFNEPLKQTSYMFNDCQYLKKVDLSHFDTSNLTKIFAMFQSCVNLETLIFFKSPLDKLTHMNFFLHNCSKIKSISWSNFNQEIAVKMEYLFTGCHELETVDLSNFKAKIMSAEYMFNECDNIKKVDLSGLVSTDESDLETMFLGMGKIEKGNLVIKDEKILQEYENSLKGENN